MREHLARAHGTLGYFHLKEEVSEKTAAEFELAAMPETIGTYFYCAELALQFGGSDREDKEAFKQRTALGLEDARRAARERLSGLTHPNADP